MKMKKVSPIYVFLMSQLLISTLLLTEARAQEDALVSITPSPVTSPAIGEQLVVSVTITGGADVKAYDLKVQFDNTALHYVSAELTDYLPEVSNPSLTVSENRLRLPGVSFTGVGNGDGPLATITFEVVAVKASTLTLLDVLLADSNFETSTPGTANGQVVEPIQPDPGDTPSVPENPTVQEPAVPEPTVPEPVAQVWGHAATLTGHTGLIGVVAFSPDGNTIASGSVDKTVRLWDTGTGTLIHTLTGHTDSVWSVAFSPDGNTIASSGSWEDNTVRLWDVHTGSHIRTLTGHTKRVRSVAFSPDGNTIASGSADKTVRLWNVGTGTNIHTLTGHADSVTSVWFRPDGNTIASRSYDKTVRLWDAETGEHKATLTGPTDSVGYVWFSPDGNTTASRRSDDKTVRLWDAETGEHKATLTGPTDSVTSVWFSPDGNTIVSGRSDDNTVRLWDVDTGTLIHTFTGHTRTFNRVSFSPDGNTIASTGSWEDNTVRLWDAETGEPKAILTGHADSVTSVWFSPDGNTIASASSDKTVRLWKGRDADIESLTQFQADLQTTGVGLLHHTHSVRSIAFSPDGNTIASASSDKTVRLWNPRTGKHIRTLTGHTGVVTSVAFSPDGNTIASASSDKTVRLWNPRTGKHIRTLTGHTGVVTSVAFSPDGNTIASSGSWEDNTVRLWDVHTGSHIRTLTGHTKRVRSVAFSPDGNTIASGSADKTVRLWNPRTGALIHTLTLTGHTNYVTRQLHVTKQVTSVAFSPDGNTIASANQGGSSEATVWLWDVRTGTLIRTLPYTGTDWSISFSPDGNKIASGNWNGPVGLWDAGTGKHIRNLTGHRKAVRSVAFSPDGNTLASAGEDKTVRLWDLDHSTLGSGSINPIIHHFGNVVIKFEGITIDSLFEVGPEHELVYTVTKNGNPVSGSLPIVLTVPTDAATLSSSIISGKGTIYITFTRPGRIKIGARTLRGDSCSSQAPPLTDRLHPISIAPVFKKRQIAGEGNIKVNTVDKYNTVVNRNVYAAPTLANRAVVELGWKTSDTVAKDSSFPIITVRFLNGTTGQKNDVRTIASAWQAHGNFVFRWVDRGQSDIRIRFNEEDNKRRSSLIGPSAHRNSKNIDPNKHTMHFYTEDEDEDYDWRDSILHEFGHALGLTHEHLSSKFTELFEWAYRGDELYKQIWVNYHIHPRPEGENPDFSAYWEQMDAASKKRVIDQIDLNFLDVRPVNMAHSAFDSASVMTYGIDAVLLKAKPGVPAKYVDIVEKIKEKGIAKNYKLSKGDEQFIKAIYKNKSKAETAKVTGTVTIDGKDDETGKIYWDDCWKTVTVDTWLFGEITQCIPGFVKKNHEYINNETKSISTKTIFEQTKYITDQTPVAVFKWGGEVRVEVYLSSSEIREKTVGGEKTKYLEMAATALLFEGTSVNSSDLEDIASGTFDVNLNRPGQSWKSKKVTLKVKNEWSKIFNLDRNTQLAKGIVIDYHESGLRGDILGGGDEATVTLSLDASVLSEADIDKLARGQGDILGAPEALTDSDFSQSDVNGDGQVNVNDLVLVSTYIGQPDPVSPPVDVNSDGSVTIADLVHVAQYLSDSTVAAAPTPMIIPVNRMYKTVQGWIDRARAANDGSLVFRKGIAKLEQLLASLIPVQTVLLPNYPNPFNPETWIPYHLSDPADVTLTIYAVDGKLVRTLALGHQAAGFYQSRNRAAYWDGRNHVGERVASGIYFYQLATGDFSETRKMVILK